LQSSQYKTESSQVSNNDQYLLFQTLIGAWPYSSEELNKEMETFINRIKDYMIKAIKEAKVTATPPGIPNQYSNLLF